MAEVLGPMTVGQDMLKFVPTDAVKILEEPLKKEWIKQRKQGNTTLDYIEGARVIEILNRAFNYQWSFEIVSAEIVQAEPFFDRYADWKDADGKPQKGKLVEQGKYVNVIGRLTVPGLGVKEAYGSKSIIGKVGEQESVYKAAMTDALKKAATMFGVAKELYLDDVDVPAETGNATGGSTYASNSRPPASTAASTGAGQYDPADLAAMKEIKGVLGITDNAQLDPFIKDWSAGKMESAKDINPQNIKLFLAYLKTKV